MILAVLVSSVWFAKPFSKENCSLLRFTKINDHEFHFYIFAMIYWVVYFVKVLDVIFQVTTKAYVEFVLKHLFWREGEIRIIQF